MARRKIRTVPDTVLREPAKKVPLIDSSVLKLIDDMIDTMRAANGVGLAAPQVGVSLRVAVIEIPGQDVITLINPEIIKKKGERTVVEGCLSVPGYQGEVKRAVTVKVKARDRDGHEVRISATDDLLAQALEHELDHLDGRLYTDLVESQDDLWQTTDEALI
ncbi:MAG: peptide deformylase [Dehalococcoidia bacterium]|nr:peptide deformylase [Dehalococcoidia bacterium]